MNHITKFQNQIIEECIQKQSGCLAVPMGTGKTLISLELSQRLIGNGPVLIVMSKTLVQNWISQINKFYNKSKPYVVFHKDFLGTTFNTYKPTNNIIVITTPDVTSSCFKNLGLSDHVLEERELNSPIASKSNEPGSFLYYTKWKCIIIDEVQKYTMQKTLRCISLYNIYAKYRWLLSGTPLYEPIGNRLLGYYFLLGDYTLPKYPSDIRRYVTSKLYPGLKATMVFRTSTNVILPQSNCTVIEHSLTPLEQKIYTIMRKVTEFIISKFGYYPPYDGLALNIIIYLRQFLVTPYLAFKSTYKLANRSKTVIKKFANSFEDINSTILNDNGPSSRIKAIIDVLDKHSDEKVVLFSCFRSNILEINKFIKSTRPTFAIDTNQSITKRSELITKFCSSKKGILLLTYQMGAEGLNLQCAHTTLLVDFWWNDGVTQQAIARVLRRGQKSNVNIYFFTSNTGMEKGLFGKHEVKSQLINQLRDGNLTKFKTEPMRVQDILKLIRDSENKHNLKKSCPAF